MIAWGFEYGIGGNKNGTGAFAERLTAAGIPVCMKGTDDAGLCYQVQQTGHPDSVLIYRTSTKGQNDGNDYDVPQYHLPPSTAAQNHWQMTRVKWPPELLPARVWMEPVNEVRAKPDPDKPCWGDLHPVDWLGRFMVEFAQLANAQGFKVCGPAFNAGEPGDDGQPLSDAVTQYSQPGMLLWLAYCAEKPDKAALSAHEYTQDLQPYANSYPHKLGRFQAAIAAADLAGVPRTFPIFITEWGWTYTKVPSWGTAVATIQAYSELSTRFPQLKAAAIWSLRVGWDDISNLLAAYVSQDNNTQGNPLADWIINNQIADTQQPQPTAPEFGGTLPQPPEGGNGGTMTKIDRSVTYGPIQGGLEVQPQKWDPNYGSKGGWVSNGQKIVVPLPPGTKRVRMDDMVEEGTENPNPPDPAPPHLNVAPLSQRDPDWANVTLGQPTGHGKTIGNWGCLLVAYNIQARYWGLTNRLPGSENAHFVSMGAFSNQFIQPAALRTAYPESVAYDGFLGRESSAMRPKIREWIDNGWPVPCRVDFDPTDSDFDQHWVLVIGYIGETDFYMADPWHGDIEMVNDRYPIAGSDILEAIFYRPEETTQPPDLPTGQKYDLLSYLRGPDGIQYDTDGGVFTQTYQYQHEAGDAWRLVKGDQGQYEFLYADSNHIYRREDTSQGNDRFYVHLTGGVQGAPWIKRFMAVGETAVFSKQVQHYWNNCTQRLPLADVTDSIRLNAVYEVFTFIGTGKILNDVIELEWLEGGEKYWFAKGWGLVGFTDGPITSEFMNGPLQGRADLPVNKPGCLDLSQRFYTA